jgi:hypothetical protein
MMKDVIAFYLVRYLLPKKEYAGIQSGRIFLSFHVTDSLSIQCAALIFYLEKPVPFALLPVA